jgi:hypothetical protein
MTTSLEKCPFCESVFHGSEAPRNAVENAFLRARTHVWMRHPDKIFRCPCLSGGSKILLNDFWRHDGTCSYCGSITPEALFEEIGKGSLLSPTDKNYKVYVGDHKKFCFYHLNSEQQSMFVDLMNAGKLNMSQGGFYVLPFFMVPMP